MSAVISEVQEAPEVVVAPEAEAAAVVAEVVAETISVSTTTEV